MNVRVLLLRSLLVTVGMLVLAAGEMTAAPRPTNPDSTDILDLARRAHSRFQRVRLRHLPWTFGWGGGDCDERLGRMCLRHGEGDWVPRPDTPEVIDARERLLDTLATLHELIPMDSGDTSAASAALPACSDRGR